MKKRIENIEMPTTLPKTISDRNFRVVVTAINALIQSQEEMEHRESVNHDDIVKLFTLIADKSPVAPYPISEPKEECMCEKPLECPTLECNECHLCHKPIKPKEECKHDWRKYERIEINSGGGFEFYCTKCLDKNAKPIKPRYKPDHTKLREKIIDALCGLHEMYDRWGKTTHGMLSKKAVDKIADKILELIQ